VRVAKFFLPAFIECFGVFLVLEIGRYRFFAEIKRFLGRIFCRFVVGEAGLHARRASGCRACAADAKDLPGEDPSPGLLNIYIQQGAAFYQKKIELSPQGFARHGDKNSRERFFRGDARGGREEFSVSMQRTRVMRKSRFTPFF
jgi:hypothetical protein